MSVVAHVALPTGTRFGDREVGGLSGLAYDPGGDLLYAVVDDVSGHPPARVLRFRWHPPAAPELVDWLLLTDDAGALPAAGADLEGIARSSDGELYVSSEGDVRNGRAPWVGRFDAGGHLRGYLSLPAAFVPGERRGPHHNAALEALALAPGGGALLAGMEGPLLQDEPPAAGEPALGRILRWDLPGDAAPEEWAYPLDPPPATSPVPNGVRVAGLVDLQPWGTRLLALERSWVEGVGFDVKLYEATLAGADRVDADSRLAGLRVRPARKHLLVDLAALGVPVDNYEGTAWLPVAGGEPLLVVVSDNNFNAAEATHLLALRLGGASTLEPFPLARGVP